MLYRTQHTTMCAAVNADVQRENMKTICIPSLCVLCALLVGCSTTKMVKTDGMRSLIITQTSDTQYCLQASETLQVIHRADPQSPKDIASTSDTLNYLKVCATVGGNTETICVREKAVQKLCDGWNKNGIGWQTEVLDSKIEGCKNVVLYYGSSTFDTKQMSRLIDNIVQDCKELGIETLTPQQLDALKEEWGR